jgi:hypothetical protein
MNPKLRLQPWAQASLLGVGHTVRTLKSDESQQTGLPPPTDSQSVDVLGTRIRWVSNRQAASCRSRSATML